jgi:hypothetical protein
MKSMLVGREVRPRAEIGLSRKCERGEWGKVYCANDDRSDPNDGSC